MRMHCTHSPTLNQPDWIVENNTKQIFRSLNFKNSGLEHHMIVNDTTEVEVLLIDQVLPEFNGLRYSCLYDLFNGPSRSNYLTINITGELIELKRCYNTIYGAIKSISLYTTYCYTQCKHVRTDTHTHSHLVFSAHTIEVPKVAYITLMKISDTVTQLSWQHNDPCQQTESFMITIADSDPTEPPLKKVVPATGQSSPYFTQLPLTLHTGNTVSITAVARGGRMSAVTKSR